MESQDATATFLLKVWPQIEANKNKIGTIAGIVIAVAAAFSFFSWRHEQNQVAAGDAVTQTLISMAQGADPSRMANAYLTISSDYPGTPAGQRALLQGAALLFTEGKYSDARTAFQRFLEAHPDDELSGQAALGVAKCEEAEGKLDDAAGQYQHVINDFADPEAVIAAKFALAEVDLETHKYANASQLFQDVAQTDPYGVLGNEAAEYLFEFGSKTHPSLPATPAMPAPAPSKTPAAPFNLSH